MSLIHPISWWPNLSLDGLLLSNLLHNTNLQAETCGKYFSGVSSRLKHKCPTYSHLLLTICFATDLSDNIYFTKLILIIFLDFHKA